MSYTDNDLFSWHDAWLSGDGTYFPRVGTLIGFRLNNHYNVYPVTACTGGIPLHVTLGAPVIVGGFTAPVDGTEVAITFTPQFPGVTPCPDGTVTPVTSITTVNGIITAIS